MPGSECSAGCEAEIWGIKELEGSLSPLYPLIRGFLVI